MYFALWRMNNESTIKNAPISTRTERQRQVNSTIACNNARHATNFEKTLDMFVSIFRSI